ncbi:hypothetical protein H7170_02075 [Candidatus Gracilibacteria bacterium]|nr:hypothetical protein [Candidatus Gracilibacteria bacterium]
MQFDLTHLLWTTILSLVISHIGANYLMSRTPRGYWFWFTCISLVVGLIFF